MASSIKDALLVIVTRLQGISVANGYLTDLGKYVRVNADSEDIDKLPAITVFSGEGTLISKTRTNLKFSRQILVEGILKVCPDDTSMDIEDSLLDMHQALLEPECKCGSATEYLDGNVSKFELMKYSITERKNGCRVQGISMELAVEYIVWCCRHSNN